MKWHYLRCFNIKKYLPIKKGSKPDNNIYIRVRFLCYLGIYLSLTSHMPGIYPKPGFGGWRSNTLVVMSRYWLYVRRFWRISIEAGLTAVLSTQAWYLGTELEAFRCGLQTARWKGYTYSILPTSQRLIWPIECLSIIRMVWNSIVPSVFKGLPARTLLNSFDATQCVLQ